MIKRRLIPAAFFALAATPAIAGQPASQAGLSDTWSALPPSAERGKPALAMPRAAPESSESDSCLPSLRCGARLYGTVRRNGAIELQVPALRW